MTSSLRYTSFASCGSSKKRFWFSINFSKRASDTPWFTIWKKPTSLAASWIWRLIRARPSAPSIPEKSITGTLITLSSITEPSDNEIPASFPSSSRSTSFSGMTCRCWSTLLSPHATAARPAPAATSTARVAADVSWFWRIPGEKLLHMLCKLELDRIKLEASCTCTDPWASCSRDPTDMFWATRLVAVAIILFAKSQKESEATHLHPTVEKHVYIHTRENTKIQHPTIGSKLELLKKIV